MEKPLLTLKPDIVNALLPLFIKKLFYSIPIGLILFGISFALKKFELMDYPNKTIILTIIIIVLIISIIPLIIKIIILHFTRYNFYKNYVVSKFDLIMIKKHSVPYNQIVNIVLNISVWDRICKAGDIVLHTAENRAPNLVLNYIKHPQVVEKGLYNMIYRRKKRASQNR